MIFQAYILYSYESHIKIFLMKFVIYLSRNEKKSILWCFNSFCSVTSDTF